MTACGPQLTAATAGQVYDLNDGAKIALMAYDLGLANIRRLAQRPPLQQGDTDLGFRIDPRYVDLFWAIQGTSLIDYRAIRDRFLEVWVPRDEAVVLTFTFEDQVRALDVYLDGELNWHDRIAAVEKVSGVFKASDPRLYDPEVRTFLFNLASEGSSGDGWTIPWAIPWAIGTDVLNGATTLLYAGGSRLAAPEYPVIRISGPIDNPAIINETTGETIDLSANGGLSIPSSAEWVDIDLSGYDRRDSKTIRDQAGTSVDQYLSTDSDLATWHLAPAGERLYNGSYATGSNIIRVTGDNVNSLTVVSLTYYDRYHGL